MGFDWEKILDCGNSASIQEVYEKQVFRAGILLGDYTEKDRIGDYGQDIERMPEEDRLRLCYPDSSSVNAEFLVAAIAYGKDDAGHPYQELSLADEPFYDTLKGVIREPKLFLTDDQTDLSVNFVGVVEYRNGPPVLMVSAHDAPTAEQGCAENG